MEPTILIAIADSDARARLRALLEAGLDTTVRFLEAGDGDSALRLIAGEGADILLLATSLPGTDGFAVAQRLREMSAPPRIIFLSDRRDFAEAVMALRLSALDFFAAPIDEAALLSAVRRAVGEREAAALQEEREARITDMRYVLEKRILKECVTGQVDDETLWFLEHMDLTANSLCAAFYWEIRRPLSEQEKEQVARHLRRELTPIGTQHMLYVHRRSIDYLLFVPPETDTRQQEKDVLAVFDAVMAQHGIRARSAVGSWVDDLMQIERSYTEAQLRVSGRATPPDFDRTVELPLPETGDASPMPPEIARMCEYLQVHYAERVSLEDVTKYAGFSKYYGGRVFKQYMGTTIIDYLIRLRIDRARQLLSGSSLSVKQIGYEVGYGDPNYFTWSFKKATGLSPVQYRERCVQG